jgi:hypothetical protein
MDWYLSNKKFLILHYDLKECPARSSDDDLVEFIKRVLGGYPATKSVYFIKGDAGIAHAKEAWNKLALATVMQSAGKAPGTPIVKVNAGDNFFLHYANGAEIGVLHEVAAENKLKSMAV